MKIKEYINAKKQFEFYILNIKQNSAFYEDIITVLSDVIINPFIYQDNDHTIIISNEVNNEIGQTINALADDFGINLKVFKSNKIDSKNVEYLNILKKLYYKYEEQISETFITIKHLCLNILEKNIDDITVIKPILINKIMNDAKLLEIINGMFINDLNVCKTANYVYMHRNTINNKLNVIKEETGLDIQKFQEAVILYALIKK